MGLTLIQQGVFTSNGTAKQIDLQGSADFFETRNLTQIATTQATGRGVAFEWDPSLAPGYALMHSKEDASNIITFEQVASGGFSYVESRPAPEAAVTGTVITNADPAVCTATSHGYAVGDRVRITGNATMKQIAGMEFTVTAVADANTFTLGYLAADGFAAAETAFTVRRIAKYAEVLPEAHFVTAVTQAVNAVVTLSSTHNYKLGDLIYFRVDADFGMVELDGVTAKVTALSTADNTVTLDLNTTAFTAFAFPLATESPNIIYAIAAPAGKKGLYDNIFDVQNRVEFPLNPFRTATSYPYMNLAPGVDGPAGSSGDVIRWRSYKAE